MTGRARTAPGLLLRAAAAGRFSIDDDRNLFPKALEDIVWLVNKAEGLEDKRNDALHAPLGVGANSTTKTFEMVPWTILDNPRALKLEGKRLLEEFAWYMETAQTLHRFANAIHWVMAFQQSGDELKSWPERPRLPHLGQPKKDE